MGVSFPVDNLLLQRGGQENLHRQLYRQLRRFIESRVLPSGDALPSSRELAKVLNLGRNTVIAAYEQLALEGFIRMRGGAPPLVNGLSAFLTSAKAITPFGPNSLSRRGLLISDQPFHHGKPGLTAFHPGLPDADNFPFNTWSKLVARRAKLARGELFGTYHVNGYPPLREAIARYLAASRGVNCLPEQIIITNGAQSAFDLLARLLTDPGDGVWMEEPGYYGARAAFTSAGAKLMPLRVDAEGWNFAPPKLKPKAIFVTPSCQHPMGVTMSMEQRLSLVQLANTWNAWIIEDDYDSEYRFQGQPIPALQGIATASRVAFVGTFAKILFPAMRLGYMVVPVALRGKISAALSATGQFAPLITQAALADFINEGHLSRHLRRMRRIYTERRRLFIEQFDLHLSKWMKLQRVDSGIQLVGLFHVPRNDEKIAQRAAESDVNVSPLSLLYRKRNSASGLLFGFAAADEKTTKLAMLRLARILTNEGKG